MIVRRLHSIVEPISGEDGIAPESSANVEFLDLSEIYRCGCSDVPDLLAVEIGEGVGVSIGGAGF